MENRTINEQYTAIGFDLIDTEPLLEDIKASDVRIMYLSSDQERKKAGKTVCGECEKVPDKYKWAVPCDFTITVFEPNVERFTDEQMRILIFHELLHVGIDRDGNEEIYSVKPHDIEDFEIIIQRYGLRWNDAT